MEILLKYLLKFYFIFIESSSNFPKYTLPKKFKCVKNVITCNGVIISDFVFYIFIGQLTIILNYIHKSYLTKVLMQFFPTFWDLYTSIMTITDFHFTFLSSNSQLSTESQKDNSLKKTLIHESSSISTKVQLISEWLFGDFNFPKKTI